MRADVRDIANALTIIQTISGKHPTTASQLLGWVVEEFVELLAQHMRNKGSDWKPILDEAAAYSVLKKNGIMVKYGMGEVDATRRLHEMIKAMRGGNRKAEKFLDGEDPACDEELVRELEEGAREATAEETREGTLGDAGSGDAKVSKRIN